MEHSTGITFEHLLAVIGVVVSLFALVAGYVRTLRSELTKHSEALAVHKIHVAENYASLSRLSESRDEIRELIRGLQVSINSLTLRVDEALQLQQKRPSR
jgi:hypothetical protein